MPLPVITNENVAALKAVQVSKTVSGNWDLFECRPVWIVVLKKGAGKLVIKAEVALHQGAAKSIKFGAKVMHKIDGETKAEPLKGSELEVLSNVTRLKYCSRGGNAQGGDMGVDFLIFSSTNPEYSWVKMKYVDDLLDLGGVMKDKTKALGLLADMRMYPEILESLGEVVAGDIFIGNEDRFSHGGKGQIGTVVNKGNILFRKTGSGAIKGIGLDWFEAQGDNVNLNQAPGPTWTGVILGDDNALGLFSKHAVDGINEVFFNKLPDLTADELLTMQNVQNFKDGLGSGRDKLKEYLAGRYRAGKVVPSGVASRMQKLKWSQG